ncbi:MAG: LysM peptidoglycan-binding domain-containing protein [Chloroflexota bacterium]
MVMRAHTSIRSTAIIAALFATTSLLSGCFGQNQPAPLTPATPAVSPAASPAASPVVVPASSPPPSPTPERTGQSHTVEEGDTLASIAQKYYEDGGLWRKIYDANKDAIGADPDSIKIGQALRIPPKDE